MAAAASKVSSTTVLRIGKVEVPIGLFSTAAKPGATPQGFTTAGPNGGVLKARAVARPVPTGEEFAAAERLVEQRDASADPLAVEEGLPNLPNPVPTSFDDPKIPMVFGKTREEWARDPTPIEQPEWSVTATGASLAAEAEGDARSRGLGQGEPLGEITRAQFEEAQRDPKVRELLRKADAESVVSQSDFAAREAALDRINDDPAWAQRAYGAEVDGAYARELVEDGSGVVVKPEDVRRGVRLEDGRFVDCTSQLEQIEARTRLETADVVAFVDATAIPRVRVKGAYYIGTDDPVAPRALRIVHDGLARTRRAAVVKLCKRSRQTLGVVVPARDALMLLELVWSEDYRPAPARALRHCDVSVSEREVQTFCDLIEAMNEPPRVIDRLRDDAIALREELFARAVAGDVPDVLEPQAAPATQDVLLAQLEASLADV